MHHACPLFCAISYIATGVILCTNSVACNFVLNSSVYFHFLQRFWYLFLDIISNRFGGSMTYRFIPLTFPACLSPSRNVIMHDVIIIMIYYCYWHIANKSSQSALYFYTSTTNILRRNQIRQSLWNSHLLPTKYSYPSKKIPEVLFRGWAHSFDLDQCGKCTSTRSSVQGEPGKISNRYKLRM